MAITQATKEIGGEMMRNYWLGKQRKDTVYAESNDGLFMQIVGAILLFVFFVFGKGFTLAYEKLKVYRLFQPKLLIPLACLFMIINTIVDWFLHMNWVMDPSGAMYWTILEGIQIACFCFIGFVLYLPTKKSLPIFLVSIGLLFVTSVIRPFLGNLIFTLIQLVSIFILYLWELAYQEQFFQKRSLAAIQRTAMRFEKEEEEFLKERMLEEENPAKLKVGFTRFIWVNESFCLTFIILFLLSVGQLIALLSGDSLRPLFTTTNLVYITFLSLLFYPYVMGLFSRVKPLFLFLSKTELSKIAESFEALKHSNEKEIFSYRKNQRRVLKSFNSVRSIRKNVRIGNTYQDIQVDVPVEEQRVVNQSYYEKDNHQSMFKLIKLVGQMLLILPIRLMLFYFSPIIFSVFFLITMLAEKSPVNEK